MFPEEVSAVFMQTILIILNPAAGRVERAVFGVQGKVLRAMRPCATKNVESTPQRKPTLKMKVK